jgi:branched-chain amino acid aminotransferase
VQRRKLFTPGPRDGILCGIVRGMVLRAAAEEGLPVHEGKVRLRRLEQADEAFLTSSVRGLRPLILYEDGPVGTGRPGPVTRALAERVARMRRPGRV